jgi:hypothetical protein
MRSSVKVLEMFRFAMVTGPVLQIADKLDAIDDERQHQTSTLEVLDKMLSTQISIGETVS